MLGFFGDIGFGVGFDSLFVGFGCVGIGFGRGVDICIVLVSGFWIGICSGIGFVCWFCFGSAICFDSGIYFGLEFCIGIDIFCIGGGIGIGSGFVDVSYWDFVYIFLFWCV